MGNSIQPGHIQSFSQKKKLFVEKILQPEKIPRTKFILVIVANTLDPTIGKGCAEDINSVRHIFEKLSVEMNFHFIELIVQGEDYGKENILGAIDILTPGNDDIVVFYYSGHGFSYEKDPSKKYPQVDLRPHPASDKIDVINAHTENLSDLFELIKGKGARLNIVIGDCCNSIIEFKRNFKGGIDALRDEEKELVVINKETCATLFCNHTTSILVASACKGEYAISDDKLGSIFTYNFSKGLKMLMKNDADKSAELHWGKLLEETTDKTFHLSKTYDIGNGVAGNQKAIYIIESRKT
ncbi:MAG: caspase family protein [Bacteroidota bacterium]|nr:caspase family protein [Bacteroidota bacterium]